MTKEDGKRYVIVQLKKWDYPETLTPTEGYFDFTSVTLYNVKMKDLADPCSFNLITLKRYSFHGIPYKGGPYVFCTEMRDWAPPRLKKLGQEYLPHAYALSAGKFFSHIKFQKKTDTLYLLSSSAGETIPLNEHLFAEGEPNKVLIVGFIRKREASTAYVLVLMPKTKLEDINPKNVASHIFICDVSKFTCSYISDWLVNSVYNNKYETYEAQYVATGKVSNQLEVV